MKHLLKPAAFLVLLGSCSEPQAPAKKQARRPLQNDTAAVLQSAANPYAPIDISPVDIAYFPVDYPVAKMTNPNLGPPVARVIYSRPHKQGRPIFGTLLHYGEHWRLGANEATELELFQDAVVQGKKVAKGRYVLYSIPQADTWTIVFNNNVYSWGLKQDTTKDVHRFRIPAQQTTTPLEFYTMVFQKTATGADLLMAWDKTMARLPFSF